MNVDPPLREITHVLPVSHAAMQDAGLCPPGCEACEADRLRPPDPPLPWRTRLRWWRQAAPARWRARVHDRLFPDCSADEED